MFKVNIYLSIFISFILLIPLISVKYLPLHDLPNLQASLWLLSNLSKTPELCRYFQIDWRPAPALALDLTVPPLAALMGTAAAIRFLLVASLFLLGIGLLLVNRALSARAGILAQCHSPWPLAGLLLFYNKIVAYGFIAYIETAIAALFVIALGLHWRHKISPYRLLALTLCAAALLVGHLHAFGCAAVALAAAEIGACRRERLPFLTVAAWVGMTALPFMIALAGFSALPHHFSAPLDFQYDFQTKFRGLFTLFQLYNVHAEFFLTAALVSTGILAMRRGWILVPAETLWMTGSLLGCFFILPTSLADSTFADYRIPIFAAWLFVAGSFLPLSEGRRISISICLVAIALLLSTYMTICWKRFQPAYAEIDSLLDRVSPGAKVLVAVNASSQSTNEGPPLTYGPMRAVWRRHALVSDLFMNGGVPVQLRPEFVEIKSRENWNVYDLRDDNPEERRQYFDPARLAGYDYLVVIYPETVRAVIPAWIHPVTRSSLIDLYRLGPVAVTPDSLKALGPGFD